jgi:hypothetical protein
MKGINGICIGNAGIGGNVNWPKMDGGVYEGGDVILDVVSRCR